MLVVTFSTSLAYIVTCLLLLSLRRALVGNMLPCFTGCLSFREFQDHTSACLSVGQIESREDFCGRVVVVLGQSAYDLDALFSDELYFDSVLISGAGPHGGLQEHADHHDQ